MMQMKGNSLVYEMHTFPSLTLYIFPAGETPFTCDFETGSTCQLWNVKTDDEDWLTVKASFIREPFNLDYTFNSGMYIVYEQTQ